MIPIELLAPAKDSECGRAAIDCGADALYIGAPRFGARENAGNTLEDIAALIEYAHRYWVRVYATVNTLLHDHEIPQALDLIDQLRAADIDGLIIQDTGLLECALPPLPVIASTQMHNNTPEKIAFLEQVGFQRAILARELTLEEIGAVRRAAPNIELECFVHGALCVGYSGQCYLSYAIGGRSGNRGQCAQPCRKTYSLVDGKGRTWARNRHLLSLRDLNLSAHLGELLEAGVTAFKIEGRLKDRAYVANVVAYYRNALDTLFSGTPGKWKKSSSGVSRCGFDPNPEKTFNRGYTTYFLHGRDNPMTSHETPKMMGEFIGKVKSLRGGKVMVDRHAALHPGDGVCFLDSESQLRGSFVNAAGEDFVQLDRTEGLFAGAELFRNHDHVFLQQAGRNTAERKISVAFALRECEQGLFLRAEDEDGNAAECVLPGPFEPAQKSGQALDNIHKQLAKTGGSIFACASVKVELSRAPFIPVAALNGLRRDALDRLTVLRTEHRPRRTAKLSPNDIPYPEKHLTFRGNVLNRLAEQFYRRHGVETIEPGAESGVDLRGYRVMTTRYCLRHALGFCLKNAAKDGPAPPLYLIDDTGTRLELEFDCANCQMHLYFGTKKPAK